MTRSCREEGSAKCKRLQFAPAIIISKKCFWKTGIAFVQLPTDVYLIIQFPALLSLAAGRLFERFWRRDLSAVECEYGMDSPTSEVLLLSEDDSGLLVNESFSNSSASSNNSSKQLPRVSLLFHC